MTAFKTILPRLLPTLALTCTLSLFLPSARAENPKAAEAAGATLFRDKGCAYCHGAAAQGTQKGPTLENIRKTWKPAQIVDQIKNGGQKMPSFGNSLSDEEIAQLVAWLRAKHRPLPAPLPAPLPSATPAPAQNPPGQN